MNRVVAHQLLTAELAAYEALTAEQLCELAGERSSRLVRGIDGIDDALAAAVRRVGASIQLTVSVGEAEWGGPHDTLEETLVLPQSRDA